MTLRSRQAQGNTIAVREEVQDSGCTFYQAGRTQDSSEEMFLSASRRKVEQVSSVFAFGSKSVLQWSDPGQN